MKILYKYFLISLTAFASCTYLHAQVVIPDANFRQFLINTYPSVMKPDQTLDTTAAKTITGIFNCYNKNVSDVTGIQYFTGINKLYLPKNNLSYLPTDFNRLANNLTELQLDTNKFVTLPDLSKFTSLQRLKVRENKLTSLPSLTSLTNLVEIFCDNNQISSMPDLSTLTNLQHFILSDNPIKLLPSFSNLTSLNRVLMSRTQISSLPDLSNCTSLNSIYCDGNFLTSLPNFAGIPLNEIDASQNLLDTLPDLSSLPLTIVKLYKNRLTFEDMISISTNPSFTSFKMSPQNVGISDTLNVVEMSPLSINLNFDNSVSGNIYNWYKDGIFLTSTAANKLVINSVSFADAGVYTCQITNSNAKFAGITVYTSPVTIIAMPCISLNNFTITIPDNECSYPIKVEANESSIIGGTAPFTYTIKNAETTAAFNSPLILAPKEGKYDIVITDSKGCKATAIDKLNITRSSKCDPVFYPNGDGVADTYYIQQKGTARIYNRAGDFIKELSVPAHWDGLTDKGEEAPTGFYVIVVNQNHTIQVSLIR